MPVHPALNIKHLIKIWSHVYKNLHSTLFFPVFPSAKRKRCTGSDNPTSPIDFFYSNKSFGDRTVKN